MKLKVLCKSCTHNGKKKCWAGISSYPKAVLCSFYSKETKMKRKINIKLDAVKVFKHYLKLCRPNKRKGCKCCKTCPFKPLINAIFKAQNIGARV